MLTLRRAAARGQMPARRPSRLATGAALTTAVLAGGLYAAAPAEAATTINCDTAAQPSTNWTTCRSLVGTAKCVWNNKNGTYTMAMGYTNPSSSILFASIPNTGTGTGVNNAFTATNGSADANREDNFMPGTYTTAFTVTWSPTSNTDPVQWVLMGTTRTWTRAITTCPTKPVPLVGSAGGLGLGALGLAALAAVGGSRTAKVRQALRTIPMVGRPVPQPV